LLHASEYSILQTRTLPAEWNAQASGHQESNALPEKRAAEPKGKESDLGQGEELGEKQKGAPRVRP
jgi:hypothetical protein